MEASWHSCLPSFFSGCTASGLRGNRPWIPKSFLGPLFPPELFSHVALPNSSLKSSRSALLKSRVASLLCTLLVTLRILNSIISWSLQTAKAALGLRVTRQFLLVGEDKVHHSTLSRGFLYYLEEEVIISTFWEPLQFLVHCCVVPPTDTRVVEIPHENHVL